MKRLSDDDLMGRCLTWLAKAVIRLRSQIVYPQIVLMVLFTLYTVEYLQFDTRRDNLVGANKKYHQNFLAFKKEFPTQDDLAVVVESESPEKNRQFVERLAAKMEVEPIPPEYRERILNPKTVGDQSFRGEVTNLFQDIFYKGDLTMLGSKALLFIPEKDLVELKQKLTDYRPFIAQFAHTTNLISLFNMVNTQFRTAKQEKNAETESLIKALPALERIITQARECLIRSGTPPSPGVTALFNPGPEVQNQMYVTFDNGRIYLVSAQAPTENLNSVAVNRLRELLEETRAEVPGLNIGLTGEPVLEEDEMNQSKKDTILASVVSLVLCSLIFIYGYQETGRPIKAVLCLIVGMSYTLAFATRVIGHLNILTITFAPILIGLAIDYGVHLISRYEEELRKGNSEEDAMTRAMVYTGKGIVSGALTTSGAFLAMWFTDFKGIQEMGIICGGGLLICLVPMMTMLPVLLLGGKQNVIDHSAAAPPQGRARIEDLWLRRPVVVAVVTLTLCTLGAFQIPKVYFDYDLLHMQSDGLPSVTFEEKLINATNSTPRSLLFSAIIASNVEQAVTLERQLTNLPSVASVDSITQFLAEDQTRKLATVGEIKEEVAPLHFDEPDDSPVVITNLTATLYRLGGYLGNAHEATTNDDPELARQFSDMGQQIFALRKQMLNGGPAVLEHNAKQLALFQSALFNDLRDTFETLQRQDNREPLRVQDLPQALHDRFVGVTGKYLLMVYPKKDVWQRQNQEEFVKDLQRVCETATGTPVQLYYYTELLKKSYEEAAYYSLIAIAILVLFHFRNFLAVALALAPVAVGVIWLGGLMGYCGIPLNPANIMTLPLVIGIGVTNGIHVLNRFAEEQTANILARSTGKAVLVSGLTAMAGFGSLILAQHRGIRSLGCVMSLGLATCMIAGLTFLPALLSLLMKDTRPVKRPSADQTRPAPGREEPRQITPTQ